MTASPPLPTARPRWPGEFTVGIARSPLALFTRLARAHGDVVRFRAAGRTFVVVAHPELAREVLVTQQRRFVRGYAHRTLRLLLGDGLLTSEGDLHRRQRRLANPAFHRDRIAAYARAMSAAAERWSDRWERRSPTDVEVDVAAEMTTLTLGIAGETLFGTDVGDRARDVAGAIGDAMRVAPLAFLPFARWALRLPLPHVGGFVSARHRLDRIVYGIIAERRAAADADRRDDLLSMLLVATDPEETDGEPMSDEQLRDEVMTLFLAGHETTANLLAWTWLLLGRNPDAEACLHAELDAMLGAGPAARAPTFDDLPRLPYTRSVLAESMRIYPPAYAIGRICVERCTLGGVDVEPGWGVVTSPWLTHHDARWWPEPERFRPERWSEPAPDRPKFAYFPFGGGSRICIGEQFAWTEATLVLATLASRWRLELLPDQHVAPLSRITLRQRPGARARLVPRSPAPS
ncbi:cytochrome P450 [Gemmatirosa kalamazoonensis]|uniref:Cytochrome P450 n=1 Tax=Gemmatirosa kalamazoonensis TaxID=861299 RepID=W0RGU0_9BACT|nr:cytochrome P450 [Gemmatirosa kalamazoonensis]AHG89550.1 cytochrome P450 [Gemmatirosa kalamazoonensis]